MKYTTVANLLLFVQLLIISQSTFLKKKTNTKQDPLTPQQIETSPKQIEVSANTFNNTNDSVSTNTSKNDQQNNSNVVLGEVKPLFDAFCFINANSTVYDLNPLKNDVADYKINNPNELVTFNVCRNTLNPCPGKSGMVSYSTANQINQTEIDRCIQIAGNSTVSSEFYLINDEARNKSVLRMQLPPGEECSLGLVAGNAAVSNGNNNKIFHQTTIDYLCDYSAETPVIFKEPIGINNCNHKIFISTKAACPKYDVYALWRRIEDNKWVFGLILIGVGMFLCFFGENFLKIAQVIAGAALTLMIVLYFVFNSLEIQLYTWQFWIIIVVAVALGCLAGWFMSYLKWLPGLVFGVLLGFVVGFFVFNLCLRFIQSNPNVVFWLSLSIFIVLGCLVGFFFEEEIAIISTSVVGSYALVRGLSIWFGGFPDERQVYELGSKGEWDQMKKMLSSVVYAYLALFLMLAFTGMFIQFKFFYDGNKKPKEEGEEPLFQKGKQRSE